MSQRLVLTAAIYGVVCLLGLIVVMLMWDFMDNFQADKDFNEVFYNPVLYVILFCYFAFSFIVTNKLFGPRKKKYGKTDHKGRGVE